MVEIDLMWIHSVFECKFSQLFCTTLYSWAHPKSHENLDLIQSSRAKFSGTLGNYGSQSWPAACWFMIQEVRIFFFFAFWNSYILNGYTSTYIIALIFNSWLAKPKIFIIRPRNRTQVSCISGRSFARHTLYLGLLSLLGSIDQHTKQQDY